MIPPWAPFARDLVHPVACLFFQAVLTVAVLSNSTPSALRLRLVTLVPLACCLAGTIWGGGKLRMPWAGLVCGTSGFSFLHYTDVALIRGPDFAPIPLYGSRREVARLRLGLSALTDFRKTGTRFQVKNVPPFPRNQAPSSRQFLQRTAYAVILHGLVLDLSSLTDPPSSGPAPFALSKIALFGGVLDGTLTAEDLVCRMVGTTAHWVLTYCYLRLCYDISAFVLVALGASQVSSWRPMFGPVSHMNTLRGFWGSTWHQLVRDPCGQPARFIATAMLSDSARRRGSMFKYCRLFLTFALSGLIHMAADVAAGVPCKESGTVEFFLLQVIGIMVEDIVTQLWGLPRAAGPKILTSRYPLLGYAWVGFWLFWTTPMWFYPTIIHHDGYPILPVSLLSTIAWSADQSKLFLVKALR